MHSPVTALLWERWRRTRLAVAIAVGLPLAWLVFLYVVWLCGDKPGTFFREMPSGDIGLALEGEVVVSMFAAIGYGYLFIMLLLGQSDRENLSGAFPGPLLRLPVSTAKMVAAQLGYGVAALALAQAAVFGILLAVGLRNMSAKDLIAVAFLTQWVYLFGQSVAWSPLGKSWHGVLEGALAFAAATWLLWSATRGLSAPLILAGFACAAGCCAVACFWFVRRTRRGDALGWPLLLQKELPLRRTSDVPFSSAPQAQSWHEWHYYLKMFPAALAFPVGVFWAFLVIGGAVTRALAMSYPAGADLLVLMACAPIIFCSIPAAFVTGSLARTRFGILRIRPGSPFALVRPVRPSILSAARLRAIGRCLMLCLAVQGFAGLCIIASYLMTDMPIPNRSVINGIHRFAADPSTAQFLLWGALALCGWVCVTWVALASSIETIIILAALFAIGISDQSLHYICPKAVPMSLLVIGATAYFAMLIWKAAKRGLVGKRGLLLGAIAFPIAALAWAALAIWVGLSDNFLGGQGNSLIPDLSPEEWCLWLFGPLLTLLPFVRTPLTIYRQRHQ